MGSGSTVTTSPASASSRPLRRQRDHDHVPRSTASPMKDGSNANGAAARGRSTGRHQHHPARAGAPPRARAGRTGELPLRGARRIRADRAGRRLRSVQRVRPERALAVQPAPYVSRQTAQRHPQRATPRARAPPSPRRPARRPMAALLVAQGIELRCMRRQFHATTAPPFVAERLDLTIVDPVLLATFTMHDNDACASSGFGSTSIPTTPHPTRPWTSRRAPGRPPSGCDRHLGQRSPSSTMRRRGCARCAHGRGRRNGRELGRPFGFDKLSPSQRRRAPRCGRFARTCLPLSTGSPHTILTKLRLVRLLADSVGGALRARERGRESRSSAHASRQIARSGRSTLLTTC